jgi:hypothetical protein
MTRWTLRVLLALSLAAGPALAAEPPAKAAKADKVVKQDWQTARLSMAEKGRFHQLHAQKEKLDCDDCHDKTESDPLFLRAGEFQAKEGDVDRNGCLTCHKSPKKPTFYGVVVK